MGRRWAGTAVHPSIAGTLRNRPEVRSWPAARLLRHLGIGYSAAKVAAPDAEFDRNEALIAFMEDIGRPGVEGDIGDVAQGDISGAVSRLNPNPRIPDCFYAVPEFGSGAHVHAKLPVGLIGRRGDAAAKGGLHKGIDIARVKAVARRLLAIGLDIKVWLAQQCPFGYGKMHAGG
jgi:hypothetical protein